MFGPERRTGALLLIQIHRLDRDGHCPAFRALCGASIPLAQATDARGRVAAAVGEEGGELVLVHVVDRPGELVVALVLEHPQLAQLGAAQRLIDR